MWPDQLPGQGPAGAGRRPEVHRSSPLKTPWCPAAGTGLTVLDSASESGNGSDSQTSPTVGGECKFQSLVLLVPPCPGH